MTAAIDPATSRHWRRKILTPRNAAILTGFNALLFVGFGVIYLSPITPTVVWRGAGGALTAAIVLPFAALAAVGGLIAARRPDNWIGWWLLGAATSFGIGALCSLLSTVLLYRGDVVGRWVQLGGVFWAGIASLPFLAYTMALLLFPDGHLPSRRWRWLVYAEIALVALGAFSALVTTNQGGLGITYVAIKGVDQSSPLALPALTGFTNAVFNNSSIAQLAISALAVVSVFLRLRGADLERRQQIKWFVSGAVLTAVGLAFSSIQPVGASPAIFGLEVALSLMAVLAIPVAVAVAMLRYRLYDIDIIINRALVYGVLAVFITAVYVGIAVGVGVFVGSGGKPNLWLSILATAIVAVGFQSLRQRLQRVANRLVYGRRATPYEVLSTFSERVAESYAADAVLPRMARVLQEGAGAEAATVWLRTGSQLRPVATSPDTVVDYGPLRMSNGALPAISGATLSVAVRHQDEVLGALSVIKRRGESMTPMEQKLVDDLANQAGLVLKNVGLTADLQQRLEELRASRQRLVAAQDTERRRLERNLHDGAQQHLVALKVKLSLAEMLASRDPEKTRATIEQLKRDADEALETLRDLARGIYPPLLAEKGLVTALEGQARKATVPVSVDGDGVRRYPQEIEATAYFCVLEALQNVQKYAEASRVTVTVRERDGALRFDVSDDGCGFDVESMRRGSGVTNMTDRLDAIGGALQIRSEPGQGTIVTGVLPVGAATTVAV